MTSTPVVLLLLRSGQASDRPSGVTVQAGQLALNFGAADPGLYFEDSAGTVAKIGPPSYGPTAPNSSPVGLAGNYPGELWTDNSTGSGFLKVWNGATFASMNVGFASVAGTAGSTSSSTSASGAILASGSLGAVLASGALSAVTSSGAVLASGALGAILASGSLGAITASGSLGAVLASGSLGTVLASGSLGAVLASGSLGSVLASGSLGTVLASGSLGAVAASGALFASGVDAGAQITVSGLPAASSIPSGALAYNAIPSGTQGSGLYVRVYTDWVKLF